MGPLLITHWGLSGPVVLRLSAWAARGLFSSNYQGMSMYTYETQSIIFAINSNYLTRLKRWVLSRITMDFFQLMNEYFALNRYTLGGLCANLDRRGCL